MSGELTRSEVRDGLREFFEDHSVLADLRVRLDQPPATSAWPSSWPALAGELGVCGLGIAPELGGVGLGACAMLDAAYEAGIGLYPGPLRSTLTAVALLSAAPGTPLTATLLGRIATGSTSASVALSLGPAELAVDGGLVTGVLDDVCDARADLLLLPADGRILVVGEDRQGVTLTHRASTDPSHEFATVRLHRTPAETVELSPAVLSSARDVAQLLVAAEQAGGIAGCLQMAAEYAKLRTQFNGPIGAFQAIAHRCAELAADLESIRGLIAFGGQLAESGQTARLAALAPLARAAASDAFRDAADTLVHVHGGIGFTWEHNAHLYQRRARTLRLWFGTPDQLRELAMTHGAIGLLTI